MLLYGEVYLLKSRKCDMRSRCKENLSEKLSENVNERKDGLTDSLN